MSIPKGKLIAVGGAEDKGTDLEAGEVYRSNLNFFELGILRRVVQEAGGPSAKDRDHHYCFYYSLWK
jgi:cyanophycinase